MLIKGGDHSETGTLSVFSINFGLKYYKEDVKMWLFMICSRLSNPFCPTRRINNGRMARSNKEEETRLSCADVQRHHTGNVTYNTSILIAVSITGAQEMTNYCCTH